MKKRYGIVLPEETYREFRVKAVEAGMSVGDWLAERHHMKQPPAFVRPQTAEEAAEAVIMEEAARKAIEGEDLKVDDKGKLSKGLGDIPGRKQETPNLSPREMQAHKDEILRRISKK